jgi:RHS repeat-associated protein
VVGIGLLLFLMLFMSLVAPWPLRQPSTALAATMQHNPPLLPPSWLKAHPSRKSITLPHSTTYRPPANPKNQVSVKLYPVSMSPITVPITAQAQQILGKDGHLEIDIPAHLFGPGALRAAGGSISLQITQLLPGSGGLNNNIVYFGTYQFQFLDSQGHVLSQVTLAHPLTISYHMTTQQIAYIVKGQKVYTLWRPGGIGDWLAPDATQATLAQSRIKPLLRFASANKAGTAWSIVTTLSGSSQNQPAKPAQPSACPAVHLKLAQSLASRCQPKQSQVAQNQTQGQGQGQLAVSPSNLTFGTEAPQAVWAKPQDFQVSLNAGGLTYTYPLTLPPGPGGFVPDLNLSYSSAAVNENHNVQAAATWAGEGWNLSLGSISWAQEDVTPGGTNRMENVWTINDVNGISGQLIPPDLDTSTIPTYDPAMSSLSQSSPYIWHTAPESHAKVEEMNFDNQPCWRVWLPDGTIEDFGCTNDSRQSYIDSQDENNVVQWQWDLDLMIDPHGNQIHITYKQNHPSDGYVRDAVISSISYDDPGCLNTTTSCSPWNPQVTLTFDSSNVVTNLTNSSGGCANWSNSSGYRCDDPVDLSGSGGLPIPKVVATYVLNDLKVNVNGNLLREYVFSYEQTPPQTITDPSTGQQESAAGYLDLTQIQTLGTNGTNANAPVVTMSYVSNLSDDVLHYSDSFQIADPPTGCPGWVPIVNGNCLLWSQSYNARFLKVLDNGEGWNETMTWTEVHNNTHGVVSGSVSDPRNCTNQGDHYNVCSYADDQSWGHVVIASRVAVSNGVKSIWNYTYTLQQNLLANFPGACFDGLSCYQGFTWGNQNDADWLDYYNGQYEGFAQAAVTQPDGSTQDYTFVATDGWGLALSTITCYLQNPNSCSTAAYFTGYYNNGQEVYGAKFAGYPLQEEDYDAGGTIPLTEKTWSYPQWQDLCPPPGVPHSEHSGGTGSDPGGTQLISQLDQNNPVVVCDLRSATMETYTLDGVTTNLSDPRVVTQTMAYSYDTENKSGVSGYDYGNPSLTTESGNDVGGAALQTMQQYYPNDNIPSSHYLTDLVALSQQQDGNSTPWSCSQSVYGSNSGYNAPPTVPDVTQAQSYSVAGSGGCTGTSNLITVQHTYDSTGNAVTAIDGDGHLGCTLSGQTQYSACATYDASTYNTHLLSAANALNQTTSYAYDTSDAGGFGQWLTSETDPNSQTTSYQYDALGRLTAVIKPGDSPSSPTISYTYTNGCSQGETTPCLELDTTTQIVSGGPTSTMKQWYDGWGNLVETQTPSPTPGDTIVTYTIYDTLNRPIITSLPYAITTPSGYVTPDQTQPRTVTSYDGLGRSLGTVTYGQGSTIVQEDSITYTIAQGVPTIVGTSSTPYEQTITLDTLNSQNGQNHQSITYADAFGRVAYTQVFSGLTPSSYAPIRTVGYSYDPLGNTTQTLTYDHTGTLQATANTTFDALSRRTGFNDPDLGACSDTPMPTSCANSGDTAWHFTYDADNNLLSQINPDNQQTDTSYDNLDRPLCRSTQSNPCSSNPYVTYFYDSYSNTDNPSQSFPSGCTAPSGNYASDPIGHVTAEAFTSSSNGSGWRCYGYDARGETDQSSLEVTTPDALSLTQTVNLSYDDGGEVTSLVYPNGQTVTTNYDSNGRAQSAYFGTPSSPDPVNFLVGQVSYTAWGQVSGLTLGGSGPKASTPTNTVFGTTLGYDSIQRPLSESATITGQSQLFFSQTRSYDNLGNVIQLDTTIPAQSGGTLADNQSYCYDDLNRLVWNGNTGTPTGGDDCGPAPTGTTIPTDQQSYSYDDLDRLTSGQPGNYTYGDPNHLHAVTGLSSIPEPYAAYDAMGNMTCRNTASGTGHTCAGSTPTGATLTYDNEGRLSSWTAQVNKTGSDTFLYDGEGNRVLQSSSSTAGGVTTVTDTITFDGYSEVSMSGGTTTTLTYDSLNGERLAVQHNTNLLKYLISDLLGSADVAVNSGGGMVAVELYWPYGESEYSWGTMPTTYNFTGQRLDSVTGLLYFNARYYDPLSGRFVRADTVQNNASGMDPYAYVGDSPMGKTDPSGHYIADDNGDFAYADDQGEARYIKNDPITSGPGYIYTVYRYTWAQIHRPTPKTAPLIKNISYTNSWQLHKYTGWDGSFTLWGIPLWQNEATFTELPRYITVGIGPAADGWDIGLAGGGAVFDANDRGVIGNRMLGLTYSVGVSGANGRVLAGWAGNNVGAEADLNPLGTIYASNGVDLGGLNISDTASVGLDFQYGISIGANGLSVSVPYFSDTISFSLADIGGW